MGEVKPQKAFDLEYFFEIAPDLLCVSGFDGYFKKVNPAVCVTLGYSERELFASPISEFIHPDDREVTSARRTQLTSGQSLLNFENRFLAKDGSTIWLSWTSVPIKRDQVIFAIAKNITYRKQLEEYDRISSILSMINDDHQKRFKKHPLPGAYGIHSSTGIKANAPINEEATHSDQFWLNSFEEIVRKNAGKTTINLEMIAGELALSQRQLFRRVDRLLGITPNKLVRVIRLQMAWEAIASGKYRTIKEIASIAGFSSRSHFSSLFLEVYGIPVSELI